LEPAEFEVAVGFQQNLPRLRRADYSAAMRLLDRYLFRELLTPLAYCLGGFLIFWIAYDLFNDLEKLQDAKLHLLDVVEYAVAMTPAFLATVLPIALLLALLYTLTNHARHNEITAMRAAGMSLWRICVPYFIVGLIASAALFALNELAVPRSVDLVDRILQRYTPKPAGRSSQQRLGLGFYNDRSQRTWLFDEFHFKAAELVGVQVNWIATNGLSLLLNASYAVRTNGVWTFYNVREDDWKTQTPLLQTNVLAIPEFDETPREFRIELKITDYERLATHKTVVPLADILDYIWLRPGVNSGWLYTQLYQHLAAPFTCLIVVLIAIPFGAASGRRNMFFGVAGSIFICFSYFVIQQFSLALGYGNHCPPWLAAWLPNLIFAAMGLILMTRVR
jgi:lipopolysaccharide export system permease protein